VQRDRRSLPVAAPGRRQRLCAPRDRPSLLPRHQRHDPDGQIVCLGQVDGGEAQTAVPQRQEKRGVTPRSVALGDHASVGPVTLARCTSLRELRPVRVESLKGWRMKEHPRRVDVSALAWSERPADVESSFLNRIKSTAEPPRPTTGRSVSEPATTADPATPVHDAPDIGSDLAGILREIRDRLPPNDISNGWQLVHQWVKNVEPYGILLAVLALFLGLLTFWVDYGDRVEERTARAWQLLTTDAPGNSGKREALEYLNRDDGLFCLNGSCLIRLKERTPLAGIDLSTTRPKPGKYLPGLNLAGANLFQANFAGADLENANFAGARLGQTSFANANLEDADFTGAYLGEADFSNASLDEAEFENAFLGEAKMRRAFLGEVDFTGARLIGANLANAIFEKHMFVGHISESKLTPVIRLPTFCSTEMPDESKCDRDCKPPGACPWFEKVQPGAGQQ
jgi:Pentapeptide repeats (8 copies)